MDIEKIALFIQERLLYSGFVLQRYDSYTTNSIYLKLDYGVMNSIRISDHRGKKHLKYRYNLLEDRKRVNRHDNGKYPRNFYGFEHVHEMLMDIYADKLDKLTRYGPVRYSRYMAENYNTHKDSLGFWAKCVLLN